MGIEAASPMDLTAACLMGLMAVYPTDQVEDCPMVPAADCLTDLVVACLMGLAGGYLMDQAEDCPMDQAEDCPMDQAAVYPMGLAAACRTVPVAGDPSVLVRKDR
jgi:hypothetical protein